MTEHTITPKLRFPEFKDDWEKKKLGNLSSQSMYGIGASAVEFDKENVYIRITDIDEDTRKITGDYTSPDTIDEKYLLEKNDILFARTGASTGKTYIHSKFDKTLNYYFAGFLIKFKVRDNYSPKFIYQYTFTEMYKNWVKVMSMRSGQPGINSEEYSKLSLYVPQKNEQEKIGIFFSKLDQHIELEEEKLELLEQQKRGYMQQIFSQDLRFKDENGDDYAAWKETTIKEIAEIKTGSKDTKDAREDGNYNFYVRSPIIHKINSYSYDGEAILTVGDGVGVGKVFHYVNGKFDYHQRVYKISDFKNYYGLLLYYYFSKNFLKEARKYNAKTSVDSVRKDMIANMKVPMPIMEEQQKIGMFLKKLESKIDYQNSKINLLKQRKRGFLQKMFV